LINPNYNAPLAQKREYLPLGLAYIAAILREASIDVNIIDAAALNLNLKELRMELMRHKPEVVGITAMTDVFPEAVKTAEIVKEDVGAITIMGGVHPSILPNETVQHPAIDIVVRGEGEMTMLELVKTLETNQGARALGEIKGITFKVNGRIVSTPQRPPIENINSLPFPARDLFPFKLYRGYQ
jgi:radical SAM superfamily enzyme YgiQ (UPF0313 family)